MSDQEQAKLVALCAELRRVRTRLREALRVTRETVSHCSFTLLKHTIPVPLLGGGAPPRVH